MSTELIINASLPETRIALQENGEIQELLIERASGKGIVGNIYKGRVTRVLPGMQAAFVDIGLEKAAFLYVDDVYVHSDIWEAEEEESEASAHASGAGTEAPTATSVTASAAATIAPVAVSGADEAAEAESDSDANANSEADIDALHEQAALELDGDLPGELSDDLEEEMDSEDSEDEDDDDHGPVEMGPPPEPGNEGGDDDNAGNSAPSEQPHGTVAPEAGNASESASDPASAEIREAGSSHGREESGGRRRRRGRGGSKDRGGERGGKGGRRGPIDRTSSPSSSNLSEADLDMPENVQSELHAEGEIGDSDRAAMVQQRGDASVVIQASDSEGRPEQTSGGRSERVSASAGGSKKNEFNQPRSRDRRVRPKQSMRPSRAAVNIQDLLKEGQEVIVQVAKDPIATKGARLTCHLSLPGRHLVCMPTIDHVGVSRRIERDDERRKLREYVERYRPKNLGFIVRTASGRNNSEQRIKQDIEYLTRIWNEIRDKVSTVAAPALVYEDLNSVLRAIRDWVTDEIDKIVVDSRYHHNEILRFVSHFMPSLKQKVELYHGDVPIFDAYSISTELSRALERKVWLKSGGYLVIDQAEALVAIDVNTGRFVGKKNLEDTILKTNLEAVVEIAYQLRLRNCGGIIILDLIDMEKEENKHRVYRALEEALKKDRARPSILKISELGLVEMTRKRTRDTMVRALCESCSHCEGKGFIKSKQTMAYEILREVEREGIERNLSKVLVQAHPDVIDILAIDERETLDQLERRYRKQIYLQSVTDFHAEQFEVTGDKQEGAHAQPSQERGREARDGGHEDRNHRNRDRGGRDRGGRDRNQQKGSDNRRGGQPPRIQNSGLQVQTHAAHAVGGDANPAPLHDAQPKFEIQIKAPSQVAVIAQASVGGSAPEGVAGAPADFDEEDRLAFLRAQAAQDAALAKLRSPGVPGVGDGNRGPRNGGGGGRPNNNGAGQARNNDRGDRGPGGRRGRRGRRGRSFEGQAPGPGQAPAQSRGPGQGQGFGREANRGRPEIGNGGGEAAPTVSAAPSSSSGADTSGGQHSNE
jgi:ribonuclease G